MMKGVVGITKEMLFVIVIGFILLLIALYVSGYLTLKTSGGYLENVSRVIQIHPVK